MKSKTKLEVKCGTLLGLLLTIISAQGSPPPAQDPWAGWKVVGKNEFSTTRSFTNWVEDSVNGGLKPEAHSITTLATGLNYLGSDGTWKDSQDEIELTPEGGAAAVHAPCKANFGPSLTQDGIQVVTSRGFSIQLRPIALYYHDRASDKTVQLGTVRECRAELNPPNQVIWHGVLDKIEADYRVTFTKGAQETDLVLLQRPKPPEECSEER